MELTGASIVVTGGASGLGLATARDLLNRGATVVIADLPTSAGEEVARTLGIAFVAADITEEADVDAVLDVAEQAGPVRGLVHCAGRGGDRTRILGRDGAPGGLATFAEVIRVNLVGTYNVLRLAAARMARNNVLADGDRGSIVLTASVAAFEGQIGQTAYAAAKAGMHGMTLVAARDLSGSAIRVNTIAPGIFETPLLGRLPEEVREGLESTVPHPSRLGRPEEFARLAAELLGNPYLNGETIRLDGAIRMAPR
jgi:NAD(P)-dependent dehydrogenase (short-subunit alcohol dehydrogenase family)